MHARIHVGSMVVLVAVGLFFASAAPALDGALTLVGSVHGSIQGNNTIPGRVGTIVVRGYADALVTPSTSSGNPTGSPSCRPLTIRKPLDKATPLLAVAWSSLETMTTFVLRFYESVGNQTVNTQTIQLGNARILSIARAGGDGETSASEQLTFGFTSAVYTYELDALTETVSCTGPPV